MDGATAARLLTEHSDLMDRIKKLTNFILNVDFENLAEVDRFDLREQLEYMKQYQAVLLRRIDRHVIVLDSEEN